MGRALFLKALLKFFIRQRPVPAVAVATVAVVAVAVAAVVTIALVAEAAAAELQDAAFEVVEGVAVVAVAAASDGHVVLDRAIFRRFVNHICKIFKKKNK